MRPVLNRYLPMPVLSSPLLLKTIPGTGSDTDTIEPDELNLFVTGFHRERGIHRPKESVSTPRCIR